ncbi:MAG: hypothetical protein COA41_00930 [Sphingopyxis sp.]|nr:MAG: hypothetical protein COA41_00930 [Sphingopyxis sp.]
MSGKNPYDLRLFAGLFLLGDRCIAEAGHAPADAADTIGIIEECDGGAKIARCKRLHANRRDDIGIGDVAPIEGAQWNRNQPCNEASDRHWHIARD